MIDADTHLHPQALKLLVARMCRSPLVAAVAGAPHVTNRGRLLLAMQVLEAASIIGLIRRTQSLTGRVGVVAGVLGLFRRDRVLAVGGYDPRMATEDIDLTWKLLLAGWETVYEPHALVGMQVPSTIRALWAQRTRWARGQGEVLHVHLGEVSRWRNHRMWLLALESLASLLWVVALAASLVIAVLGIALGGEDLFGFAFAWGIAIAVVATLQLIVAIISSAATTPPSCEHSWSRPCIRSPTGSSPLRQRCARRPSRSSAARASSASSGTSRANGSAPVRSPVEAALQRR